MKTFDYLSAFLILFVAITLGELTMGVAYSLDRFSVTTFYFPHILFIVTGYLGSLDYIMKMYALRRVKEWGLWQLLIAIIPGACLLLITKLVFPNIDPPEGYDFIEVFERNKIFIFILSASYFIAVNTSIAIIYKIKSWGLIIVACIFVILFIAAIVINSSTFDLIVAILMVLGQIIVNIIYPVKIKDHKDQ